MASKLLYLVAVVIFIVNALDGNVDANWAFAAVAGGLLLEGGIPR
ncbi:MAG TPA: hypothetical protein VJ742_13320 [Nitrososphaera sp.]|nr:hypothetical protein [Nitrososphaera sp.]